MSIPGNNQESDQGCSSTRRNLRPDIPSEAVLTVRIRRETVMLVLPRPDSRREAKPPSRHQPMALAETKAVAPAPSPPPSAPAESLPRPPHTPLPPAFSAGTHHVSSAVPPDVINTKANPRRSSRNEVQHITDVAKFARARLAKLFARRHVEEDFPKLNRGPRASRRDRS